MADKKPGRRPKQPKDPHEGGGNSKHQKKQKRATAGMRDPYSGMSAKQRKRLKAHQ